jgi:hypothetical protein
VRGRQDGRGREETQEEKKGNKQLEEKRVLQDHYNTLTPSSH